MVRKVFILSGILLSMMSCVHAAGPVQCPESISVNQKLIKDLNGWESLDNKEPHRFDRVALYFGHPSEKESLVPDDPDNEEQSTWTLSRKPTDDFYWIGCHYQNTSMILAKKVDGNAKKCVATYKQLPTNKNISIFQNITCQ